jgi:hypothetical protein
MFREFRIVAGLMVFAIAWPAACNEMDERRRAAMKRDAFTICLGHRAELDDCAHLRPDTINATAMAVCEMRHDPRACWDMKRTVATASR